MHTDNLTVLSIFVLQPYCSAEEHHYLARHYSVLINQHYLDAVLQQLKREEN